MSNIYIIGFMGSGKTSVSPILAELVGYTWKETDDIIQQLSGYNIPQLFEKEGEGSFRKWETHVLKELSCAENLVVSTGGGIVLNPENIKLMRESGRVILLTAAAKTTLERIGSCQDRPLLKDKMTQEYIETMISKRKEFYQDAAHFAVKTDSKSARTIALEIAELLNLTIGGNHGEL